MAAKLEPGTSALVALIENTWCGEIAEPMEPLGGRLFRQALPDEIDAQALEEAEG